MTRWEWIALGYYAYLLIAALTIKRFERARIPALMGTAACGVVLAAQNFSPLAPTTRRLAVAVLVPLVVLLAGYWLSGLFFTSPMHSVERWLMAIDNRLLRRTGILSAYDASPRIVGELFESA